MWPVTSDNQILLVASHPHDEVVLDRKDGVFHAIDHEQLAAWTIQHSGLEQAKLLRVGGIRRHGVGSTVAKFVGQRLGQGERILHLVLGANPLGLEHVVTAATLRYHRKETVGMGVRDPHRVVAARADAASHDPNQVEAVISRVGGHPIQDAAHEAVWRSRVVGSRRTVAGSRDLEAERGKTVIDVGLRARSVVGFVSIQPADEQQHGPAVRRLLVCRQAEVRLDRHVAVTGRFVRACKRDVHRHAWRTQVLAAFDVRCFAPFPRFLAHWGAVDREPRNAVNGRRAQVEVARLRGVSFCLRLLGRRDQLFRHGKEGPRVLVRSVENVRLVARSSDEFREDRVEILDVGVGERIDAMCARRPSFLVPERGDGVMMGEVRKPGSDFGRRGLHMVRRRNDGSFPFHDSFRSLRTRSTGLRQRIVLPRSRKKRSEFRVTGR